MSLIEASSQINVRSSAWASWRAARLMAAAVLIEVEAEPSLFPSLSFEGRPGRLFAQPLRIHPSFKRSALNNGLLQSKGHGTWEFGLDIGDITGKHLSASRPRVTRREAIAYLVMCSLLNSRHRGSIFVIGYEPEPGRHGTFFLAPSLAPVQ